MKDYSLHKILLAYIAFYIALIFPFWLHGEVVAPYRQAAETGAPDNNAATRIENRKFSDYANAYIPEINEQLNGRKSGWLVLWTDESALGRPLHQISGFSRAYLPSWIIASITDNPQRFITILSLSTCFFAGLFLLMLSQELHLSPVAGLLTACCLAASPQFTYWLTFPMFSSVVCWSTGALYAVTRLAKRLDLPGWSLLTFCIYSLLMTGYPQLVIFHAYILSGYVMHLGYRQWRTSSGTFTARYLAAIACAAALGGLLSVPMILDLAHTASESARLAPDPSFFTVVLPRVDSLVAALRILALSSFPEIFGNPISPSYPFSYDGLSATPLHIFFALLGLLLCFRKTWGWWLAIFLFCALAFIHPLYLFGIKHLGFNLSRNNPLFSATLPLMIVTAYGTDALMRRLPANQHSRTVALAVLGTTLTLLLTVVFGLANGVPIRWDMAVIALAVITLLAGQVDRTRPILLLAALTVIIVSVSFPLILRQEPTELVATSPLVETVRDNLPPDSRYAVAAPGLIELPPNLNATLRLPSIHGYDSLSSRSYHALIKELGGDMQTYGRWNAAISPDYGSTVFWMSNIALVLSPTRIEHRNLSHLGKIGNVHLHQVLSRMGYSVQVFPPKDGIGAAGIEIEDPRSLPVHKSAKTQDQGDLLEFEVANNDSQASVLILSQKFHRDWHALALTASGWSEARTTPIKGVFQGVLLPERTQKVRLQFKPYVRFAWIAHIFWLLVLILLIIRPHHFSGKL